MEVHIFLLVPAGVLLQELTGDDLVREDKCGVSTYYWSFPGEAGAKKSDEVKQLREGNTNVQRQVEVPTSRHNVNATLVPRGASFHPSVSCCSQVDDLIAQAAAKDQANQDSTSSEDDPVFAIESTRLLSFSHIPRPSPLTIVM
jgi:hypothetical protein|tara:strand:+ start:425 stop:856 length:432 start_codon:yes stop_codon:yes gene_type:complete